MSYEDSGCGVALLSKETIDRCINSFVGRPVTVRHTKTTPGNMKEVGHGYVTAVEYDPSDGWWYGVGVVDTDEAARKINEWGFGSVGYGVNRSGRGGEYHAIKYDEEILDFSGEHLAIVDRPRYEGATIRLNSKKTKMNLFKWVKKSVASRANASEQTDAEKAAAVQAADKLKADAEKTARENAQSTAEDISGDTELEIPTRENGKTVKVKVADLVEAYNGREDVDPAAEIDVDGKPVAIGALVDAYRANAKTKVNGGEGDDEDEKKKENAELEEAAAKAKENAKPNHFRVLLNASQRGQMPDQPLSSPDTLTDRIARGAARYGTNTKN